MNYSNKEEHDHEPNKQKMNEIGKIKMILIGYLLNLFINGKPNRKIDVREELPECEYDKDY